MKLFFIISLLIVIPINTFGQDNEDVKKEESKNEISFFVGASTNSETTAFSFGIDYQFRINKVVGVGAIVDVATEDYGSIMLGPAVYLHASKFEFVVSPTIEFSDDDSTGVLRLGVAYEIELSKFSISPSLNFDTERGGEETLVYGLSFGFVF